MSRRAITITGVQPSFTSLGSNSVLSFRIDSLAAAAWLTGIVFGTYRYSKSIDDASSSFFWWRAAPLFCHFFFFFLFFFFIAQNVRIAGGTAALSSFDQAPQIHRENGFIEFALGENHRLCRGGRAAVAHFWMAGNGAAIFTVGLWPCTFTAPARARQFVGTISRGVQAVT